MTITIIAAIGKNRELGKDNQLLWHLPNDLKRFKKVTKGHDVIMGRKTYESLGKPLPNRVNIVITRNKDFSAPDCVLVHSLREALEKSTDTHPYILGGAEIYKQSMDLANQLDLTLVDSSFEADAFFPEIDLQKWEEVSREEHLADEVHAYNYSFVSYKKRK